MKKDNFMRTANPPSLFDLVIDASRQKGLSLHNLSQIQGGSFPSSVWFQIETKKELGYVFTFRSTGKMKCH